MFNFNIPRYEKVVGDAIALRPQIEKAVDEICAQGYTNLFFIGCGGTYAHSLPMKYWLDTTSDIDTYSVIAAEFMAAGHKKFTKDSVCVFSTRSGNTKEIVAAAKYCKEAGARTMVYVSNDNTPVCEYADYKFASFAEDDCLCEAIYTYMIILLSRFKKNAGEFEDYDEFLGQYEAVVPYLIKAKEQYEDRCAAMAARHKDTDYHMVIGSGMMWGEAYDYAMCILMDRVMNFSQKVTKVINIFDTKEIELPFTRPDYRKIVSPMVMYAMTERLSCHLEKERNHPLTTRRYYRQMEY